MNNVVAKQADSSLWKALVQLWPKLGRVGYCSIGNGANVHASNDCWIHPRIRISDLNNTVNKLLGTPTPMIRRIQARREEPDGITSLEEMGKLKEIKKGIMCGRGTMG